MENYSNIILHIPHASQNLPDNFFKNKEGKELLMKESSPLIDYFTDDLFRPSVKYDRRFKMLVAHYCRTLLDVERLKNDPLEKRGMGILYGKGERRSLFALKDGIDELMLSYYDDYNDKAAEIIRSCSFPLIIDCHSFSSHSTKLVEMTPEMAEIDICLGYNEDETRPSDDFIDIVEKHFAAYGYNVARNRPFSNSKTFDTGNYPHHSLMIEINKKLYMNEETLEKTAGFNRLQNCLFDLYDTILDINPSASKVEESQTLQ